MLEVAGRRALVAILVGLTLTWPVHRAHASEATECADAAERAQPERRAGKLSRAREELSRCARSTCPAAVQADCTRWLAQVDATMPSVVVRALGPGGEDAMNVRVLVDGRVMTERLDGKPFALDPGEHAMRYELAGSPPVERRALLAEGERDRVLRVQFEGPAKDKRVEPPAPQTGQPPPPPPEKKKLPVASLVLGGISIAALGGGAAFYGVGLSERSDLSSTCAPSHTCDDARISASRDKLLVGDVLVGVSIAAAAAAIYLAITHRSGPAPSTANAALRW